MESVQLNWLDYMLIGLVLLSTVGGAVRGLIKEILPIVSLVLGLVVAYKLSPQLQPYALEWWEGDTVAYIFCFIIVFVLAWVLLGLLGGLLYRLVKASAAGSLDKLFGMVLGLVRGVAVAVLIVVAMLAFLPPDHASLQESMLAPKFLYIGQVAVALMPEDAKEELRSRYDELMEKSENLRRGVKVLHPESV
jgi:membrane protein required for colicin V production